MRSISEIITKEIFVNAHEICKEAVSEEHLKDINLKLLKDSLLKLSKSDIETYYGNYLDRNIFYSIPELFTSSIVDIPKGNNSFREYRFFAQYSLILYNAIGILFYKVTEDLLGKIDFETDNVYTYAPNKISNEKNKQEKVKIDHTYRKFYSEYLNKQEELINEDSIILRIDLRNYFNSIDHTKLVETLDIFGQPVIKNKYKINSETKEAIIHYFDMMMNSKKGIPQGRVNCFSDFFGDLYLKMFDKEIKKICESEMLSYKAMIRYVDDITIVFERKAVESIHDIYKELHNIENKIALFLFQNLNLKINDAKTIVRILKDDDEVIEYLEDNSKQVSFVENFGRTSSKRKIQEKFNELLEALEKFRYPDTNSQVEEFDNKDKEKLKLIFSKDVNNYLKSSNNIKILNKVLEKIDMELTVDNIYILIALVFLNVKGTKPYFNAFDKYMKTFDKYDDKRMIHILLMGITQDLEANEVFTYIEKVKDDLAKDNYGRYLLIFSENYSYDKHISLLNEMAIYNKISYYYKNAGKDVICNSNVSFNQMIKVYLSMQNKNDALIDQINNFVEYYIKQDWGVAYNSFYNFFHELCKIKLCKKEDLTSETIITNLKKKKIITVSDQIIINKFANMRNENQISHPSDKFGNKNIKIGKEELDYFVYEVSPVIINIIEKL